MVESAVYSSFFPLVTDVCRTRFCWEIELSVKHFNISRLIRRTSEEMVLCCVQLCFFSIQFYWWNCFSCVFFSHFSRVLGQLVLSHVDKDIRSITLLHRGLSGHIALLQRTTQATFSWLRMSEGVRHDVQDAQLVWWNRRTSLSKRIGYWERWGCRSHSSWFGLSDSSPYQLWLSVQLCLHVKRWAMARGRTNQRSP